MMIGERLILSRDNKRCNSPTLELGPEWGMYNQELQSFIKITNET